MSALNRTDFRALAFLKKSAFARVDGQWRFGGTRVGDSVVERLVLAGRASHLFPDGIGECIVLRAR